MCLTVPVYEVDIPQIKKRGRPIGYKLSAESKAKISKAKTGQSLSEDTKDKISNTLLAYFKNLHPLSKEIYDNYKSLIEQDDIVSTWYTGCKEHLNTIDDVLTERALNAKRLRELPIELNMGVSGNTSMLSHVFKSDPEAMCELRLLCEKKGVNILDAIRMLESEEDEFRSLFGDIDDC